MLALYAVVCGVWCVCVCVCVCVCSCVHITFLSLYMYASISIKYLSCMLAHAQTPMCSLFVCVRSGRLWVWHVVVCIHTCCMGYANSIQDFEHLGWRGIGFVFESSSCDLRYFFTIFLPESSTKRPRSGNNWENLASLSNTHSKSEQHGLRLVFKSLRYK